MPASIMVGTSGNSGLRVLDVTASARALPLLMKGMAVLVMSNMNVTLPLTTSIMAGELPR
ncbi:hypothetical protein D3C77_734260 [compost metagenome]